MELQERLALFEKEGKLLEAQRLRMRTQYDLEMMQEVGYCNGIENYSAPLDGRGPGEAPNTLLDFFPDDFLMVMDESHQSVPQLHGQYEGDRSRKEQLIEHGFRLPSAADNRPLRFEEVMERINQVVFLSATPGPYELKVSTQVAEQIVRPTGLVDPEVLVRPTKGQIDNLIEQIGDRTERGDRVLVTTLTKKMAEDLTDYLLEQGLRVRYLHSNVDTIQRIEILRDLRLGEYDVLVGINLLREGLDLPEVSLVAILDADKEGFLRSETSLIQTIGRAARHVDGQVIMYADQITDSMRRAISETQRRRQLQIRHNEEHGIDPQTIRKAVTDILSMLRPVETAPAPGQGPALPPARPRAPRPRRAARRRGAPAHPHPRGGDARSQHRAAVRVRRPAPGRDQGPEARAAGRRLTTGRRPLRETIASAPIALHAGALLVVLLALLPLVGTAVSYSADEGAAIIQAESLADGDGWIIPHPFPEVDPAGDHYPLENSPSGPEGTASYAKHPAYPWLLAGADRLGGHTAMVLVSLLGTWAAAVGAAYLARSLVGGYARTSLWLVGAGCPLLFDGYWVIAHSVAAALVVWAVWAALRLDRSRWPWLAVVGVPVLVAAATMLRTEVALYAVGLGWPSSRWERWSGAP